MVNEEFLCLARGPLKCVMAYEGYVTNGFRFHTKKRQRKRKTQNSGVMVKGDADSGQRDFYGLLEKVIVLEYDSLKIEQVLELLCLSASGLMSMMIEKEFKRISLELLLLILVVN